MNSWKVSTCSLLILSLILLPGILDLNPVYAAKIATAITTIPSATTINAGSPLTDSATFTVESSATGLVTYSLFIGSTCSATPLQSQAVIITTPGTIPASPAFIINVVGTYSLKASYSGDTSYKASSSKCEAPVIVIKATPTVLTTLSSSTITVRGSVTDFATFGVGTATSTAHGTMTYQVFAGGSCSGSPIDSSVGAVANGMAQPSKVFKDFNTVGSGSYSFAAIYSGDQNNNAVTFSATPCELLTVNPASPTISTTLSPPIPATIIAGQSVTDSATLAGATPNAGGTVTYTLFWDEGCKSGDATTVTSTVTVTNGHVPNSIPLVIRDAHKYSVYAAYSGDLNNNPANNCESPITVNMAIPVLSTELSAGTISSATGTVTDTATLTGATANAGGTITIVMYTGTSCTNLFLSSGSLTVTGNGPVSWTPTFTYPIPVAFYSFEATYTGDHNNMAAVSLCEEPFNVALSPSVLTTTLSSTSPSWVASSWTITVGGTVTDSATLSGVTSTAGGTVNYHQYNGGSCTGGPIDSDIGVAVSDGVVAASKVFFTHAAGFYSFNAFYSGDAQNAAAPSSCEVLTVNKASPTISTLLSATTVIAGGSVTDEAILINAAFPVTGMVTFTMYTGNNCGVTSGSVVASYSYSVNGAGVATSGSWGSYASTSGTYSFQAFFQGDANNNVAYSSCELLTVTATTIMTVTTCVLPGEIIVTDAGVPGVFSQSPSGGAPTPIWTGAPYVEPGGVAIDSSGNLIVSDIGAHGLFRQSPCGGAPTPIFIGAPYIHPVGVAIDSSGNIIVADAGESLLVAGVPVCGGCAVFRQNPSGGTPTVIFTGTPYVEPIGVAIDSSGNIIVVDESAFGVFSQSPSGGAPTPIWTGTPYVEPRGIAIDSSGNIIVADDKVPAVFSQSPSGGAPTSIWTGTPYVAPLGVAVDSSGNIIVADLNTGTVFRQSPSGGAPTVIFAGTPYSHTAGVAIETTSVTTTSITTVGGNISEQAILTLLLPAFSVGVWLTILASGSIQRRRLNSAPMKAGR